MINGSALRFVSYASRVFCQLSQPASSHLRRILAIMNESPVTLKCIIVPQLSKHPYACDGSHRNQEKVNAVIVYSVLATTAVLRSRWIGPHRIVVVCTSRRFLGAAAFAALNCLQVHFLCRRSIVHPARIYVCACTEM